MSSGHHSHTVYSVTWPFKRQSETSHVRSGRLIKVEERTPETLRASFLVRIYTKPGVGLDLE